VLGRYRDPLDEIWLTTARRLGMRVVRSDDVFASWDGAGTLSISTARHFDPDDSLAQLILHEICHAIVEGPDGREQIDWGLYNYDDRDAVREHAAVRLQAALLDRHGLRGLFAVTTDYRPYFDALEDPLIGPGDPALPLALTGWDRANRPPWTVPLETALSATAALAAVLHPFASPDSLWSLVIPVTQ